MKQFRAASAGLLAWLWLFSWASPQADGRKPTRLASWNLHNLFDEHDDPNSDEVFTARQVEQKLERLAAALGRLDSDLVAVQEVENQPLLERLARRSGYRYAILVEGNDLQRGIDVGFLSRARVSGYRTHKHDRLPYVEGNDLQARFSRDCLEVHLPLGPGLIVLVNHFKAKLGNQRASASKRRAQALRVQQIAQELQSRYQGQALAIAGDLNDSTGSWALEPLREYHDPFLALPLQRAYTLKHRGERVVLDHIYVNPVLQSRLLRGGARVWQEKTFELCSDHYPISLDLAL